MENQIKPEEIPHPLEHEYGCGLVKNAENWNLHHISTNTNETFTIKIINDFWGLVNNLLTEKNVTHVREFYLFRNIDNKFFGPSNENLNGVVFNGAPIKNISEIIFDIKPIHCDFTPKQIIDIYIEGAMWLIGSLSKYEHLILGIRMKLETNKATRSVFPQLRFWIVADKNSEKGQKIIDVIKNEFMGVIYRADVEFLFKEQVITFFSHILNNNIIDDLKNTFKLILAEYGDSFLESEITPDYHEFKNNMISEIEKKSHELTNVLKGHTNDQEIISKFDTEFSKMILALKDGKTPFVTKTEIRQQLPREQRNKKAQTSSKGRANK